MTNNGEELAGIIDRKIQKAIEFKREAEAV